MEFHPEEFPSFHGFCSAKSAENRLKETRHDSFLIRKNQHHPIRTDWIIVPTDWIICLGAGYFARKFTLAETFFLTYG